MSRQEFSRSVRAKRLLHASDANGQIRCEECGCVLKRSEVEFDHDRADALNGDATFENCRVLGKFCCHPTKTKNDVKRIAKAKRQEAAHLGIRRLSQKIKSRGFVKTAKDPNRNKPQKQLPAPLAIYVEE